MRRPDTYPPKRALSIYKSRDDREMYIHFINFDGELATKVMANI